MFKHGNNFEIMGKNCKTFRLLCRAVFNFIAEGYEGILFREIFLKLCNCAIECILEYIFYILM